jgi:hypothetical protein
MTDWGRSHGVQIDFECRRHLTERCGSGTPRLKVKRAVRIPCQVACSRECKLSPIASQIPGNLPGRVRAEDGRTKTGRSGPSRELQR